MKRKKRKKVIKTLRLTKRNFCIKKYILAIRIRFSNCHFVLIGGFTGRLTSLINGSYGCLKLASLGERNFNRDEDVIAYIAETQQKAPRSNANTTWTAGMVTNSISFSSIFLEDKKSSNDLWPRIASTHLPELEFRWKILFLSEPWVALLHAVYTNDEIWGDLDAYL